VELPSPYGSCDPADDYVQSQCLAECEANYLISNCSCKDIYMPGILYSTGCALLLSSVNSHELDGKLLPRRDDLVMFGLKSVVELRGGPRGPGPPERQGGPLETPGLRGYKGASKRPP